MSKHKAKTRAKTVCPVFGHGRELHDNVLPSYHDDMRYYLLVQNKLDYDRRGQHPTISEISEIVAQKLELLWNKASIPIVSHTRVLQKIRQYHDKYKGIKKHPKSRQNRGSFKIMLKKFHDEAQNLFDVAACKCEISKCKCEKLFRVPIQEQPFLADQRNLRLMCIGSVDILTTNNLKRKLERKSKVKSLKLPESIVAQSSACETVTSEITASDSDNDYTPEKVSCIKRSKNSKPKRAASQNRIPLPSLTTVSDRYGVSDRAAAALASSVLEDVGLIQSADTSMVVDRSKLRRQRIKTRIKKLYNSREVFVCVVYISTDGKIKH